MQLEDLPNEILLGTFAYLSLHELNGSLRGLNQHLDDLIQSIYGRTLRVRASDAAEDMDIMAFFASTVVALEIYDESQVNLPDYSKMQSLAYTYATDHQLKHLLQSSCCHSRLVHLDITSDDLSPLVNCMLPNQFPSLRRLVLRNIDSIPSCPWRLTPSLSSIDTCSDESFVPSILLACPILKRLSLFIFQSWTYLSSICTVHQHLQYLTIEIVQPGWTVQMIDTLFSSIQTPRLNSFSIRCHHPSLLPFDFLDLAYVLTRRVPCLHRFECDLQLIVSLTNIDLETIGTIHPALFSRLQLNYLSYELVRVHTDHPIRARNST